MDIDDVANRLRAHMTNTIVHVVPRIQDAEQQEKMTYMNSEGIRSCFRFTCSYHPQCIDVSAYSDSTSTKLVRQWRLGVVIQPGVPVTGPGIIEHQMKKKKKENKQITPPLAPMILRPKISRPTHDPHDSSTNPMHSNVVHHDAISYRHVPCPPSTNTTYEPLQDTITDPSIMNYNPTPSAVTIDTPVIQPFHKQASIPTVSTNVDNPMPPFESIHNTRSHGKKHLKSCRHDNLSHTNTPYQTNTMNTSDPHTIKLMRTGPHQYRIIAIS